MRLLLYWNLKVHWNHCLFPAGALLIIQNPLSRGGCRFYFTFTTGSKAQYENFSQKLHLKIVLAESIKGRVLDNRCCHLVEIICNFKNYVTITVNSEKLWKPFKQKCFYYLEINKKIQINKIEVNVLISTNFNKFLWKCKWMNEA